jgi:hypothetical protein
MRAVATMIRFILRMTFVLAPATTAFVSCTTRRACYSKIKCFASTATFSNASEIMDILKTRYGERDQDVDWTRARNYAYRASKSLDMEQVNQVLSFLDERTYNLLHYTYL